jgi:hypothetical protein
LVVSGVVDGFLPLDDWKLESPVVVVDLSGVVRVTSFGVRGWMNGLAQIKTNYLGFVRCPSVMLDFFATITNATGGGEVISVDLPYECEACGHEFNVLRDARIEHALLLQGLPGPAECPRCKEQVPFVAPMDSYLSSLGKAPPKPPAVVTELERAIASSPETATTLMGMKAVREQMESIRALTARQK